MPGSPRGGDFANTSGSVIHAALESPANRFAGGADRATPHCAGTRWFWRPTFYRDWAVRTRRRYCGHDLRSFVTFTANIPVNWRVADWLGARRRSTGLLPDPSATTSWASERASSTQHWARFRKMNQAWELPSLRLQTCYRGLGSNQAPTTAAFRSSDHGRHKPGSPGLTSATPVELCPERALGPKHCGDS